MENVINTMKRPYQLRHKCFLLQFIVAAVTKVKRAKPDAFQIASRLYIVMHWSWKKQMGDYLVLLFVTLLSIATLPFSLVGSLHSGKW